MDIRTNRNPLPTPPRMVDMPQYFSSNRLSGEPMAIVKDDEESDTQSTRSEPLDEDRFQLSPIPSTATLPVSNLPHRQNFRALTAEDSDIEELKNKRANAFMRRSIDSIQYKPAVQRMASSSSMRVDQDVPMARSIPRGSVDVHMASCSSSPITSLIYRERERADESMQSRRPSTSSYAQPHDTEELDRFRQQTHKLHEVLELSHLATVDASRLEYAKKSYSPESSEPVSRNPSPLSNSSQPSQTLQNPLLQRPGLGQRTSSGTISRASTAAQQAERERARSLSLKEPPAASSSAVLQAAIARDRDRERDALTPTHQAITPQASSYHARRSSVSNSVRGRSSTSPITQPPGPSGLTRQLWATQEAQRA